MYSDDLKRSLMGEDVLKVLSLLQVYVEVVILMYSDDLKRSLMGEDVLKVLSLLQGSGSGVDVWLGSFAMVRFMAALGVEVGTGKELLEVMDSGSILESLAAGILIALCLRCYM
ncbi:hypothetical protein Droror1_Dr00019710 [Drosera rotundifolia]